MNNTTVNIRQGEIYYADLSPVIGSEQGGVRPVIILQNDIGNKYSPTTIVCALTSKHKKCTPTHVNIAIDNNNGLKSESTVLCEQFRTIDKRRIKNKIGHVDCKTLQDILSAVKVSLNIF